MSRIFNRNLLQKEQGQEKSRPKPAESEPTKFLNCLLFAFESTIFSYLSTQFILFKHMIAPRYQIQLLATQKLMESDANRMYLYFVSFLILEVKYIYGSTSLNQFHKFSSFISLIHVNTVLLDLDPYSAGIRNNTHKKGCHSFVQTSVASFHPKKRDWPGTHSDLNDFTGNQETRVSSSQYLIGWELQG